MVIFRKKILSRIWRVLLATLLIIATLKVLFVGYDVDEQYALSMSFRLLKGDFPIRDMWEPHQTSSFLASLLMIPYLFLFQKISGIVLYLRFCGLLLHGFTAFLFYGCVRHILEKNTVIPSEFCRDISLLIVCIYFLSLPKLMFFPEFSNMQLWFLILLILCLIYAIEKKSYVCLAGAGCFLTLEVLSYPSTILLLPVCIYVVLCHYVRKTRGNDTSRLPSVFKSLAVFLAPSILGIILFIGYLLTGMSFQELITLLPIIASDGSHTFSPGQKLLTNAASLREIILYFLLYGMISLMISIILKKRVSAPFSYLWAILLVITTFVGQIFIWLYGDYYPNYPMVEYFFLPLLGFIFIPNRKKKGNLFFSSFVILPLTAFIGICLFTNHPFLVSAPFLGICTAGTLLCILLHINRPVPVLRTTLYLWVLVLIFGKCYLIRTSNGTHYTLSDPVSLMREGPAQGIIADRETVLRYRDTLILLKENVPAGAKVFYIGTSCDIYMAQDFEICSPSTISSPTFDEKIDFYFAMHPDKIPDYIIFDTILDNPPEGSWLKDYMERCCLLMPLAQNDYLIIYKAFP